jgi:hypothetical protein
MSWTVRIDHSWKPAHQFVKWRTTGGWCAKCHTIDCTHNTFLLLQKHLTCGTELILIGWKIVPNEEHVQCDHRFASQPLANKPLHSSQLFDSSLQKALSTTSLCGHWAVLRFLVSFGTLSLSKIPIKRNHMDEYGNCMTFRAPPCIFTLLGTIVTKYLFINLSVMFLPIMHSTKRTSNENSVEHHTNKHTRNKTGFHVAQHTHAHSERMTSTRRIDLALPSYIFPMLRVEIQDMLCTY